MPKPEALFLARHLEMFREDRFEEMARNYLHPLAIYSGGRISLRRSYRDTVDALYSQKEVLLRRNIAEMDFRLLNEGNFRNGRTEIDVRWIFLDGERNEVGHSTMRYFFWTPPDGRLLVELVEYLDSSINLPPISLTMGETSKSH